MSAPSERPTCATCRYFVEHYLRPAPTHGTCRARPPLANVAQFQLKWPEVDGREWCGEHKPIEHQDAGKWIVSEVPA